MINYEGIEVENLNTDGFEVTLPSAMEIAIAPGTFTHYGSTEATRSFPAIEFDIVADAALTVVYDVYLLGEDTPEGLSVCVDRTELGINDSPAYEGAEPLLHCLMSILVPAGTASMQDVDINVRTINRVVGISEN